MAFRSKSPERAVDELRTLTTRHPGLGVLAVDNIMDRDYFATFLPLLAEAERTPRMFYEVKANLGKDDLRLLRAAGVRKIQPGIESLSDEVLRMMRKGVTAIENVQLLKWCAELDIRVSWNILYGFPGESDDGYREMTALIPLLTHLQPPTAAGMIRLDRFSPNYEQAAEFGFRNVRPLPAYQHVYGLEPGAVDDLAYFFAFDESDPARVAPLRREIGRAVTRWRDLHGSSDMWWVDDGTTLVVWDLRSGATATTTSLTGAERQLYLACDRCCSAAELATLMRRHGSEVDSPAAVAETLAPLVAAGIVMSDGRRYLSLAVGLGDRQIPTKFLASLARTPQPAPTTA